jgi:predicted solute-binding protein
VLCQLLAQGHLDVALVSSFEFLRNPIYKIVDDVAIGSDGPVYSVAMAYARGTWPRQIELDPASATGIALLQILMAERGEKFSVVEMPADKLSPLEERRGRFLIGDQAIAFRQKFGQVYEYWDLGEEWHKVIQLPFVYALWLIRPEVSNAETVAQQLRALRDRNLAQINQLIAEQKNFDRDFSRGYYQDFLRFQFAEREKKGLEMFHRLCVKFGLLPQGEIELAVV